MFQVHSQFFKVSTEICKYQNVTPFSRAFQKSNFYPAQLGSPVDKKNLIVKIPTLILEIKVLKTLLKSPF